MKCRILILIVFVYIGYLTEKITACENFPCTLSACEGSSGPITFTLGYELTANGGVSAGSFTIDSWSISTQGQLGNAKITQTFPATNSANWAYTAAPGKCGVDCFTVQGRGTPSEEFDTINFCYQVTIQSPPPLIANPLNLVACKNTSKLAAVSASGFTAIDASSIRFSHTGAGPSHGLLSVIDPISGSFTYTPNINFTGTDSFFFTATNLLTSQVAINIVTINVDPGAQTSDFSFLSCQNSTAVSVLNATGGSLAYTYIPNPASSKGVPIIQLVGNSSPIFTYTPSLTGGDFFFFSVQDGAGCNSNVSTGNTNVTPSITAGPISFTICSNQPVTQMFNVTGGHPGLYSFSIPVSGSGKPTKGTATINAGGTFTYTPFAGSSGTDNFIYFAGDGICNVVSNVITATIDRAPQLVYQPNVSTCQDTTLQKTVVDDSLSQQLTPSLGSGPNHGSVSFVAVPVGFEYVYNPTAGYAGPDSFVFSAVNVTDPTCSATGMVNITVLPSPIAGNISVTGCFGEPVSGVLAPTGGSGSYPVNQYVVFQPNPANGQVIPNSQYPNFSYVATPSFSGADLFFYSVQDTNGCISATGTVNVFVNTSFKGISLTIFGCVNGPITGQLMATGGTGSYTFGIMKSNDNVLFTSAPIVLSEGTITAFDQFTGNFTYQFNTSNPLGNETFTFIATDSQNCITPQTTVTIIPVQAPVVNPISFSLCADGSYTNNLTAQNGSGIYSFTYLNGPTHGTLNPFNTMTGLFVYNPTFGYAGLDGFSYQATDLSTECKSNLASALISVTNQPAPSVQNFTLAGCIDGSIIGNFTASGGSGNYLFSIKSGPTHGSIEFFDPITGAFIYQSTPGYTGQDSIDYNATDLSSGCTSNNVMVDIFLGCL